MRPFAFGPLRARILMRLPWWANNVNTLGDERPCRTPHAFGRGFLLPHSRSNLMAGEADKLKGRVKEAAGALTDDDRLRREGKIDQAAGKVKDAAQKTVDKAKEAVKRAV